MSHRRLPDDIASASTFHLSVWLSAEMVADQARLKNEDDIRRIYNAALAAANRRILERLLEDARARRQGLPS